MKKNMKKDILAFTLLFICSLLYSNLSWCSSVKTETTHNKEKEWIENHLSQHLLSVSFKNKKVCFVSDGQLGIFNNNDPHKWWITEFSLGKNDSFFGQPDHHAHHEFRILDFNSTHVILEYKSSFDHRSFGPDLITIDVGEIKLFYNDHR